MQCNWETEDSAPRIATKELAAAGSVPGSSASSVKSAKQTIPSGLGSGGSRAASTVSVPQTGKTSAAPIRVSYLTEQTSHHPPVSAFWVDCPQKGIYARGFDQISAKFTGTSIKVSPGEHNLGIFITLERRNNETYQLKHPAAHLGGLFRGSLSVTVGDTAYITCPDTKLKAILNYFDEGWLRGSTNKMEGIIFKYDPENDDKVKIKDVPEDDIVVRLGGPWKEKIQFTMGSKSFVSHCVISSGVIHYPQVAVLMINAGISPTRSAHYHNRYRSSQRGPKVSPTFRQATGP